MASDDIATVYEKLAVEIEQFLQATSAGGATGAQSTFATMNANMHVLHECLLHARRNSRDFVSALTLLQKVSTNKSTQVFTIIYDNILLTYIPLFRIDVTYNTLV